MVTGRKQRLGPKHDLTLLSTHRDGGAIRGVVERYGEIVGGRVGTEGGVDEEGEGTGLRESVECGD